MLLLLLIVPVSSHVSRCASPLAPPNYHMHNAKGASCRFARWPYNWDFRIQELGSHWEPWYGFLLRLSKIKFPSQDGGAHTTTLWIFEYDIFLVGLSYICSPPGWILIIDAYHDTTIDYCKVQTTVHLARVTISHQLGICMSVTARWLQIIYAPRQYYVF